MTATPIPRTLAMTAYADLDTSIIDELPPGRSPIITKLAADNRREEIMARVRAEVAQGRQAYWVCPLVEESEALQLQTAVDTHTALEQALAPLRVGLIHGRLSSTEKAEVMEAFRSGNLDVLVATTPAIAHSLRIRSSDAGAPVKPSGYSSCASRCANS